MRPTIIELLEGLERLLTEEVSPHVAAPHAREVLQNVAMNLGRLQHLWPALPGYLQWDNRELERLLAATLEQAPAIDSALAARIQETLANDRREGEVPSQQELEARNAELRDLLAAAIPGLAGSSAPLLLDDIRAHLREALRRHPGSDGYRGGSYQFVVKRSCMLGRAAR